MLGVHSSVKKIAMHIPFLCPNGFDAMELSVNKLIIVGDHSGLPVCSGLLLSMLGVFDNRALWDLNNVVLQLSLTKVGCTETQAKAD